MIQQSVHPKFGPIKLGKKAPRLDKRTLQFKNYRIKGATPVGVLPPIPAEVSWVTKVPQPWGMYLNDTLGCCVEAAMGHMVKQWSFYAGDPFIPTDQDVLTAYEQIGGYVPGDPSTDNGSDMLTALNYWRQTGIAGHKITAYMAIDPTNLSEIREAIQLFGNLFVGIQLPLSAQGETAWTVADGGIYTPDGQPGSWGGHCVPFMASSPLTHTCVTWGGTLKASHNFALDYIDEIWACLSPDWIAATGLSPSQLKMAQLMSDLEAVTK
jgi:hypothetical protein